MKKFLILGLFAALSFVACKSNTDTTAEEAPAPTEDVILAPAEDTDAAAMPADEAAPAEGTEVPAEGNE